MPAFAKVRWQMVITSISNVDFISFHYGVETTVFLNPPYRQNWRTALVHQTSPYVAARGKMEKTENSNNAGLCVPFPHTFLPKYGKFGFLQGISQRTNRTIDEIWLQHIFFCGYYHLGHLTSCLVSLDTQRTISFWIECGGRLHLNGQIRNNG